MENRNFTHKNNLTILHKTVSRIPILKAAFDSKQLAKVAFAHDSEKYRRKQEWRSFFAALINPTTAIKWFEVLNTPDFIFISKYRNRLYFKPFRVYMSTKWHNDKKRKVIEDTYRYILSKGALFKEVISNKEGIELARFYLNDTIEGYLKLGYDDRYRKEGELVLSFECEPLGGTIAAASFSFEEINEGQWACRIACIQGHPLNAENSSKTVQKLMFGLRPKSFLIIVLQDFARHMGFVAVYGAGDAIQVYRRKHFIHLPQIHKIKFDYDAVWMESSGHKCSDGWFELPIDPVRKNIKDLKTSKRALYTRRYLFLDALSLKIAETVKNLNL